MFGAVCIVTDSVAASIAAAVTRTPRLAAQVAASSPTGAAVARQMAMAVSTAVITLSPFQSRRAAALAVVQGAPMAAKAARRIAARIIATEGVAALLAAVIRSPGSGLRRLTVLLDGRRLSTGRSASVQVITVDARNLTVVRDIRRLPARKDD